MTVALVWLTLALAAVFVLLVATIVARRFLDDRRRAHEAALRPRVEQGLAEHLTADEASPMAPPQSENEQRVLLDVALETVGELHGRERSRLVAVVEQAGIVAAAEADLGSRLVRRRRSGAETLRQLGSPTAAPRLRVALFDPDLDTALTCAAALAELPDTYPLAAVLDQADAGARERPGAVAAVLVTLARRHPGEIGAALRPRRSLELRRLAAAVVGEMRLSEHVAALRAALADEDDELVARAARGVGKIGDDEALESLLTLVESDDRAWFVRVAATGALGEIGDQRALAPLESELESGGWVLQEKAARALRSLGASGEAVLRRALDSPAEAVREHARVALER